MTVFDPRLVPIVGIDHHLLPVPAHTIQAGAMRERFLCPPQWEPEIRGEARFVDRATADAAVLIALIERENGLNLILTERAERLTSHSGQIAFPGGKVDVEDESPVHTAMREAQEEVGLDRRHVEVLGILPRYLTGSAYLVTPVVALVNPTCSLHPNPDEVADVFEVPLEFLMNPANHERHALDWQGSRREWYAMPYRHQGVQGDEIERYIWGATAGMLRNLYRFLSV